MSSSSSNQTSNQPNSPISRQLIEPARVTLEIENFCSVTDFRDVGFVLPKSNSHAQFRLICFPQNHANKFRYNYTTIYLFLDSCNKGEIIVRNKMAFLNANGDKCYEKEIIDTYNSQKNACGGLFHILYDHVKDPKNEFLINGKLSIYCEVEEIDLKNPTPQVKPKLSENPVLANYESLLESGKFSDVSLIIGESKLLAHKNILSAQSKVFEAMFEHDFDEIRENKVKITDVPVEVCEQMLRYIYTGKIPLELDEYAADLFIAADKYQLDHLKSACEQHLTANLNIESVATTFLLADMHHAAELKSKCTDFITDNMSKVMTTDGWKALTTARIELTVKLLKQIAIQTNR